jgi:hypothetical protein
MPHVNPEDLVDFNKAGVVVTDATGNANVVFRYALPNDLDYVVAATIITTGIGYGVSVTGTTNVGFSILTWVIGGAGSPAPGITVGWILRAVYND